MAYATVEELELQHRAAFLDQWLGGIASGDRDSYLDSLLASASGRINAALKRGRYPVPIVEDVIELDSVEEVLGQLREHCCNLAVGRLLSGTNDLPEGPKKAYDESVKWLKEIASGAQEIAGVERASVVRNYSFIQDGEDPFLEEAYGIPV